MVGVAQLVERWIVVPVAVGSNPTTHPTNSIGTKVVLGLDLHARVLSQAAAACLEPASGNGPRREAKYG